MGKYEELMISQINDLQASCVGGRRSSVIVKKSRSSFLKKKTQSCENNIFEIIIEIAGLEQTWEIIFDPQQPASIPDVIFGQSGDSFVPDIQLNASVNNWNISTPKCLFTFIQDLFTSYLQHQRERLNDYHQIKDEFRSFVQNLPQLAESTEVHVKKNGPGTYNDTITILVPIDIDISNLPPLLVNEAMDDCCYLLLTFEPPNLTSVKTSLHFSKGVLSCLGGCDNFRIPVYGATTMCEYIQLIQQLVKNTIQAVSEGFEERRLVIFSLICEFGRSSIVEVDTKMFLDASFLLNDDGFQFLLFVSFPDDYNEGKPKVMIQSIYKICNSEQQQQILLDKIKYPKSMDPDKIVQGIKTNTKSAIANLKKILMSA